MFLFDKPVFVALESVTHRIQRFCGLDNFFLAKVAGVAFVVCIFDSFTHVAPVSGRPQEVLSPEELKVFLWTLKITYIPIAFILGVGSIVVVSHMAKTVYRDQLSGLSNRWKVNSDFIWLRFLMWATLVSLTVSMVKDVIAHPRWLLEDLQQMPLAPYGGVLPLLWIYLVCCDPQRPAPSWLRRKVNAWLSKVQPIGQN